MDGVVALDAGAVPEELDQYEDEVEFRRALRKKLEQTALGFRVDVANAALSIITVGFYIWETSENPDEGSGRELYLWAVEIVCTFQFACNYLLKYYACDNRKNFVQEPHNIMDGITTLPLILEVIAFTIGHKELLMLCARVLRICRILRLYCITRYAESEITQQLNKFAYLLGSSIFMSAAFYNLFEKDSTKEDAYGVSKINFWDSLWVTFVTITTVGYGDLTPETWEGRMVCIVCIAYNFVVVPMELNNLSVLLAMKSPFARASFRARKPNEHVIVCGNVTFSSVSGFLQEFFHEDHGNTDMSVILLHPVTPKGDLLQLIKSGKYANQVKYIEGTPMDKVDLKRASATFAKGYFILSDKHRADPDMEDASNILRALYIKHNSSGANPSIGERETFLQLIRQESKSNVSAACQATGEGEIDQLVCTDEFKMGLLGISALCPAFTTLISNLITSADDTPPDSLKAEDWHEEYCYGCGFELYRTSLSRHFSRKSFREIAAIVYTDFGAVMFALDFVDSANERRVAVCPNDFVVGRASSVSAFVIAPDVSVTRKIATYQPKDQKSAIRHTLNFSNSAGLDCWGLCRRRNPSQAYSSFENDKAAELEEMNSAEGQDKIKAAGPVSESRLLMSEAELARCDRNPKKKFVAASLSDLVKKVAEMKKSYHTRGPIELEEASLDVDLKLTGHIIVCGPLTNFYPLIAPLRRNHLEVIQPIVLMVPPKNEWDNTDRRVWDKISMFEDVWILEGLASDYRDLKRVNIESCVSVIILAPKPSTKPDDGGDTGQTDLVDADSIFAFQHIQRFTQRSVLVELVSPNNMSFLVPDAANAGCADTYMMAPYVRGWVFTTSMLDTLICQAFYNRDLLTVLRTLVTGGGEKSEFKSSDGQSIKQGFVSQIPVPAIYAGMQYSAFFLHFLQERGMVCLGLFRSPSSSDGMPFVYTNPK
eukprot:gene2380-3108_t